MRALLAFILCASTHAAAWQDTAVRYEFRKPFPVFSQQSAKRAMAEYESNSALTFVEGAGGIQFIWDKKGSHIAFGWWYGHTVAWQTSDGEIMADLLFLHEIGVAVGLEVAADSVMEQPLRERLRPNDIERLRVLYGQ